MSNIQLDDIVDHKIIYVDIQNVEKLQIMVHTPDLTSGWLYSEVLRQLIKLQETGKYKNLEKFDFDNFICLKSKNFNLNLDFILSEPSRNLEHLPNGALLEPFYRQVPSGGQKFASNTSLSSNLSQIEKLTIDDFEIL